MRTATREREREKEGNEPIPLMYTSRILFTLCRTKRATNDNQPNEENRPDRLCLPRRERILHSGLRPATLRVGEMRVTRDLARCMRCATASS